MKTTIFKRTVVSHALHIALGAGVCMGLVACNEPEPTESATTLETDQHSQADAQPTAMDMGHDETTHANMDHEGMNHDATSNKAMNHEGMNHENMAHNDMNPTEPAEALGQDYSIYQVSGDWVDHDNNHLTLDDLKGKNQVVVMAYTSCQHTCPILVRGMKKIESELTPQALADTEFLLVTLDTERDTPTVMKNYAEHNELDDNWHLIRSNASTTRMLANTLNIKYQFADNGDINHSNFISVLDKEGRLVAQEIGVADSGIQPLIAHLNNNQ